MWRFLNASVFKNSIASFDFIVFRMSKSRLLAMFAGVLGALASTTGKLGMDDTYSKLASEKIFFLPIIDGTPHRIWLFALVLRIMLLAATLVLNCVMWSVFVESMQGLNSGEALVMNTGTNMLFSAFIGWLAFGEVFGMYWWIGASFILIGIILLKSAHTDVGVHHRKKE